jgi:hypothetical protein
MNTPDTPCKVHPPQTNTHRVQPPPMLTAPNTSEQKGLTTHVHRTPRCSQGYCKHAATCQLPALSRDCICSQSTTVGAVTLETLSECTCCQSPLPPLSQTASAHTAHPDPTKAASRLSKLPVNNCCGPTVLRSTEPATLTAPHCTAEEAVRAASDWL